MNRIISKFCCCSCKIVKTLKKELERDKEVEKIYKEITQTTECYEIEGMEEEDDRLMGIHNEIECI